MNILRPAFDAALEKIGVTPEQRDAAWLELRGPLTTGALAPTATPLRWTKESENLRRTIALEKQALFNHAHTPTKVHTIVKTYGDLVIRNERTGEERRVVKAYDHYKKIFEDTAEHILFLLREHGHMYSGAAPDADGHYKPLDVVVANELAAGRYAGTDSWVQWVKPSIVRNMVDFFEQARAQLAKKNGHYWMPFSLRISSNKAAGLDRLANAWRIAFAEFCDNHADPVFASSPFPSAHAHGEALADYWRDVKVNPTVQEAVTRAIRTQCQLRRSPSNARFKTVPTTKQARSVWYALDYPMRERLSNSLEYICRQAGVKNHQCPFALAPGEKRHITRTVNGTNPRREN